MVETIIQILAHFPWNRDTSSCTWLSIYFVITFFSQKVPSIHLQQGNYFSNFLSHRKCRNFSIIRQNFSENIADSKDEFVGKDEDARARIQAPPAALAGVGSVDAVAAP